MARVLRGERGWGIFPRMELFSVVIGGFGGYCIGYLSAAYDERALLKKERIVNGIRKKAAEALRDLKLHEKKRDEFERSLRGFCGMKTHCCCGTVRCLPSFRLSGPRNSFMDKELPWTLLWDIAFSLYGFPLGVSYCCCLRCPHLEGATGWEWFISSYSSLHEQ